MSLSLSPLLLTPFDRYPIYQLVGTTDAPPGGTTVASEEALLLPLWCYYCYHLGGNTFPSIWFVKKYVLPLQSKRDSAEWSSGSSLGS